MLAKDPSHIVFMVTSRSGLGHLRRVASIAGAMKVEQPGVRIGLFTNASITGLTRADMAAFDTSLVVDRCDMSSIAARCTARVIVADTMVPQGIELMAAKVALILRETPDDRLDRLRMPGGRCWDLVLIPNPVDHWFLDFKSPFSNRIIATGWIYRKPLAEGPASRLTPMVLIATGGGGTVETASGLARKIDAVIRLARRMTPHPFEVVQAVGPRSPEGATISGADVIVDPGGDLNEYFAVSDAVVSTAGYNSILELAITTTPAMLMSIARTYDDQEERARTWGERLGHAYREDGQLDAAEWLAATLRERRRRPAVDIGPSGATCAAREILELLH
jgi:predicted glycosyltransferase